MERQNSLHKNQLYKLANSSLCCKYIDDVTMLGRLNDSNSIEWDLNFIPPTLSRYRQKIIRETIAQTPIEVRYHLPYSFIEIAHPDNDIRMMSMLALQEYIKFIAQLDGHLAVLHIGYNEGSQASIALDSLSYLAHFAEQFEVQLCVENLVQGLTCDESFLAKALSVPNVAFCLDIGHADVVMRKNESFTDFLRANIDKVSHAHCYKTEDINYNHIPFSSLDEIKQSQVFSLLLQSKCSWLTMELERLEEQNRQAQLLRAYLSL